MVTLGFHRPYHDVPCVWVPAFAGTTPVMMRDRAFESMTNA
jgi:hypothetical protein